MVGRVQVLTHFGCMLSFPGSATQPWHADGPHVRGCGEAAHREPLDGGKTFGQQGTRLDKVSRRSPADLPWSSRCSPVELPLISRRSHTDVPPVSRRSHTDVPLVSRWSPADLPLSFCASARSPTSYQSPCITFHSPSITLHHLPSPSITFHRLSQVSDKLPVKGKAKQSAKEEEEDGDDDGGGGASEGTRPFIAPVHALNVFVPLVHLTLDKGPTEFVPGSHIDYDVGTASQVRTLGAGSALLFDYRLKHRGLGNNSTEERPLLYITYARAPLGSTCTTSDCF